MRHAVLFTSLMVLAFLVLAFGLPPNSAVQAESESGAGLALALRASPVELHVGSPVELHLDVKNMAAWRVRLPISCDPAADFRLHDESGALVWQLHADCTEVDATVVLEPGQSRTYPGVWPGTARGGAVVAPGAYSLYGVWHTKPLTAQVGPVLIEVLEGSAPPEEPSEEPTEPPEHPTEQPRHPTEPPEHPTEQPRHPTETPHEPGPVHSGPAFPITDREGRQVRPDVAGHPELGDCQNLVVWWDETEKEIWGRFVEREWKGEPFLVSGRSTAEGPAKVAYNHGRRRWLVVWASGTDAGHTVIRGRYVDCDDLEGEVFAISEGTAGDDQPAVAAHGEHYAVVWRRALEGGGHRIIGAHVAGLASRQLAELTERGEAAEPAIACEARGDCLVAWTRGDGAGRDVVGRYWFPREEITGAALLEIAVTGAVERYPSVAWNAWHERSAYAVTWTHEGDTRSEVRARVAYRAEHRPVDNLVLGEGTVTVSREGRRGDHGDVGALGRDFVVVWSSGADAPVDIEGRRLVYKPEGRALKPRAVVEVSDEEDVETYPAVASAGDPLALTVWQIEWSNGSADITGRHVAVPAPEKDGRVSLLGVVEDGGIVLLGSVGWSVRVRKVLAGDFACRDAQVRTAEGAQGPSLAPGDLVSVRADPLPSDGPCVLEVGAPGTYIERSPNSQAFLPILDASGS